MLGIGIPGWLSSVGAWIAAILAIVYPHGHIDPAVQALIVACAGVITREHVIAKRSTATVPANHLKAALTDIARLADPGGHVGPPTP